MHQDHLSIEDKFILLNLARKSIVNAVEEEPPIKLILEEYSKILLEDGASFVTLTKFGVLRGCIGTLSPYQPLVQDVCEHAVAAALSDYRFPPVKIDEIQSINIEISRLSIPRIVEYRDYHELIEKITPGIDGVIIEDGIRRATFLPQVWDKLPDIDDFFSHLCQKMGSRADLWKTTKLQVSIYQVEEFHE